MSKFTSTLKASTSCCPMCWKCGDGTHSWLDSLYSYFNEGGALIGALSMGTSLH